MVLASVRPDADESSFSVWSTSDLRESLALSSVLAECSASCLIPPRSSKLLFRRRSQVTQPHEEGKLCAYVALEHCHSAANVNLTSVWFNLPCLFSPKAPALSSDQNKNHFGILALASAEPASPCSSFNALSNALIIAILHLLLLQSFWCRPHA